MERSYDGHRKEDHVNGDSEHLLNKHRHEVRICQSVSRWHFPMLNDMARNECFRRALRSVVKPDSVVLDIGTGTGLFALYAEQSGAKAHRIYACESSRLMASVAAKVFQAKGKNIQLLRGRSSSPHVTQTIAKQSVDILVTEIFDAGLLGEHVLKTLHHAWRHFLHENSIIIPWKARVFLAAFQSDYIRKNTFVVRSRIGSLSLGDALYLSSWLKDEPYTSEKLTALPGTTRIFEPKLLLEIDFCDKKQIARLLNQRTAFESALSLAPGQPTDGFALWFELIMDKNEEANIISTGPSSSHCWEQAIFPVIPNASSTLQLQGHFFSSFTCRQRSVFLDCDMTPRLNDQHFVNLMQSVAQRLSANLSFASLEILDASLLCLVSLHMLQIIPHSNLTVLISDKSVMCSKLNFLAEVAGANCIELSRISGITQLNAVQEEHEGYDLVLFDPVLKSGRLDPFVMNRLLPSLSRLLKTGTGVVLPSQILLMCRVVQSEALMQKCRVRLTDDLSLSHIVNQELSVTHQQELLFSSLPTEALTEDVLVHQFDFLEAGSVHFTRHVTCKVVRSGLAHAVLYWFLVRFCHPKWDAESTFNTLTNPSFDQAAVVIPPLALNSARNSFVCVQLRYVNSIIDFSAVAAEITPDMDICRPPLYWVDGCCYRGKLPSEGQHNNWDEADSDSGRPVDHSVRDAEDLQGPIQGSLGSADPIEIADLPNGRKVAHLSVASAYFPMVIGKKGATKKRLEFETQTSISIPKPGREGEDVVVCGDSADSVASCCLRIQMIVDSARSRQTPTHFVSIPMNSDTLQQAYTDFQRDVLNECSHARGLDPSCFQTPTLLHLTIGVLTLMDENERQRAARILKDCHESVLQQLLPGSPLLVEVKGLEIMNDDPSEVDVIYAKANDPTGRLQSIANLVSDRFVESGYMKAPRGSEVKLHMTVVNTIWRESFEGNEAPQRQRRSLDARPILDKFADRYFGHITIDQLQLNQRRFAERSQDGYYGCTAAISITGDLEARAIESICK